jgi:3',5'-cyclic-AMP phosphodiesterase
MTRLAWMTDLHLNFLTPAERRRFLDAARDQADAFVISGDIAESRDVVDTLLEMQRAWQKPLYFVLGNHDFYRGSIRTTRAEVARLAESESLLTYLTATGVVELSPQTALVGHDGWADARLGDFDGSTVILNDYVQMTASSGCPAASISSSRSRPPR